MSSVIFRSYSGPISGHVVGGPDADLPLSVEKKGWGKWDTPSARHVCVSHSFRSHERHVAMIFWTSEVAGNSIHWRSRCHPTEKDCVQCSSQLSDTEYKGLRREHRTRPSRLWMSKEGALHLRPSSIEPPSADADRILTQRVTRCVF